MDPRALFARLAEQFVAGHAQLPPTTRITVDGEITCLEVPAIDDGGFGLELAVSASGVTLSTDRGFHEHFEFEEDPETFIRQILGFSRDLLSPQMRLRELQSNNRPYRWFLEAWDGANWVAEFEMGLVMFNFVGKRSQQIFQNRILEGHSID